MNKNDLQQIRTILKDELDPVKRDIASVKTDVSSIKETVEFTKKAVIDILDWTQDIHESIFLKKIPERIKRLEEAIFPKNQN